MTTTASSTSATPASTSTTGYSTNGAAIQITGLASGLNTAQIVNELMQVQKRPMTALQTQQDALTARNTQLTAVQTALANVSADAMTLLDPAVFRRTQTVASSDPSRISCSVGTAAGVGAYEVAVTQLAGAAQRTFTFTSPASAGTITIDGHATAARAGASIQDLVNAINNDAAATVYATASDAGTLVLSSRQTGDTGSGFIQVADDTGSLIEQPGRAREGRDAAFTVDGVPGTASGNTVANAIPGVTLTLSATTSAAGPVTVNVGAPAPDAAKLEASISTFITDYNTALTAVRTQLAQKPTSSDATQGTLYNDPGLRGLLSNMRSTMIHPGDGLPSGLSTMLDIGISTGATSGSGRPSASSLAGDLTLSSDTLQAALQRDPTGVQKVMGAWAKRMTALVDAYAGGGGTIDQRITGDDRQSAQLGRRISSMQSALNDRQRQLTQQFAQLEAALSSSQSRSSWLAGQITALPSGSSR